MKNIGNRGFLMPDANAPTNEASKVVPLRPDQEIMVRRRKEEREFLPAMLEIVDTPPSPTWRITSATLCVLLGAAAAWTCLAKIDIVAVAPGRVVPVGQVKVIQPIDTATIRTIRVDEGDHVHAGDVLVELDPTEAQADLASLRYDRSQAILDAAIANFLLLGDDRMDFGSLPGIDNQLVLRNRKQATEELRKFNADLAAIDADIAEKHAAFDSNAAQIDKARALIPLVDDRYETMKALYEQHISPKPPMLDAEQGLVERQSDLKAALASADEIRAEIASLAAKRVQTASAFMTDAMGRRTKAEEREAELNSQILKIEQKARDRSLRAPVDGTVQEVKIHTPGAVVSMADTLMTIVPDGAGLEVEANIANDDIGFAHEGQQAELKIDAFPFTRYGLITGTLLHVSRDAQQPRISDGHTRQLDEYKDNNVSPGATPPIYLARVGLDRDWIMVGSSQERIKPGMGVTVEFKTGRRRVAEYLLSPVIQAVTDSGRER